MPIAPSRRQTLSQSSKHNETTTTTLQPNSSTQKLYKSMQILNITSYDVTQNMSPTSQALERSSMMWRNNTLKCLRWKKSCVYMDNSSSQGSRDHNKEAGDNNLE